MDYDKNNPCTKQSCKTERREERDEKREQILAQQRVRERKGHGMIKEEKRRLDKMMK